MFFLALSPILWLIVALTVLRMSAWKACSMALAIAWAVGIFLEGMTLPHAVEATLEGVALACWPILLVIVAAIFTYTLTLRTHAMDTIQRMLTSVSSDRRVLILLIGWGFGGFLEGMAGFGTAIAIPAGMLAGLGIPPVLAASVCLIANSVPTAYGSIGIPLVTLGGLTSISSSELAIYTALQLAPLTLLCPFLMTIVTGGSLKALSGMTSLCALSALSFLLPELAISYFIGPDLAVVAGAIVTMGAIVAYAKKFPINDPAYAMTKADDAKDAEAAPITLRSGLVAWLPVSLIFLLLLATSKLLPVIHDPLTAIQSSILIYDGPGGAPYTFTWIATPGVLILLAAFLGGHVQGASLSMMTRTLGKTVYDLRYTMLTIIAVIATAKVMGYAGMTHAIAETAVAATGTTYPAIAAFIGSIGTFITGSATSSCVLFGKLQTDSALAIGAGPSVQAWVAAANATGACAGKMISPQSIAIAIGAIGAPGCDGRLLHFAAKVYVPFIIAMGLIVYFGQALVK